MGSEEGWVVFLLLKKWMAITLLWDFSRKITILWNGLFFCGAKVLSVAIFLLIRESFFFVCQGPLELDIVSLSCVSVTKSKQVGRGQVCHNK